MGWLLRGVRWSELMVSAMLAEVCKTNEANSWRQYLAEMHAFGCTGESSKQASPKLARRRKSPHQQLAVPAYSEAYFYPTQAAGPRQRMFLLRSAYQQRVGPFPSPSNHVSSNLAMSCLLLITSTHLILHLTLSHCSLPPATHTLYHTRSTSRVSYASQLRNNHRVRHLPSP